MLLRVVSEVDAITMDVSGYFSDPDSDTLTYTTSVANSGANVSVSLSDDTLTVTPGASAGTATVTVTASDVDRSATQTFTVTVELYYPPETVGTIPDHTLKVGGTDSITSAIAIIHVSDSFSHRDGDTMTYSATSSDTSKATVNIVVSEVPSGTLATLTVTAVAAGMSTITVRATDAAAATATQTFSVTVYSNRAPVKVSSISTQTVSTSGSAGTVDVSPYFSDPDGNPLTYSASSSNTSKATVSVSGSTLTVTAVAAGWATITVTATDPSNTEATQSFTVIVISNHSPISVGTIPSQLVRVGATAATVDASSYFSDPDGNPLTYSASSSNTSKATVSVSGSTLTITAVAAGSSTITVTATDTYNASHPRSFPVKVIASGAVTTVGTIPNQTVFLSGTGTATVDVSSYFSGPVGETLTYSATSSNTSIATVGVSEATLTITGVAAGSPTIAVTATLNSNASATQSFSVTVYSNRAPLAVGTIPAIQMDNTGASAITDIYANNYFSDPDGNTLTYTASSSNTNVAEASVGVEHTSTVYVRANGVGTATVTITATDPSGATATQTVSVTVNPQTADTVPGLSSTEQLLLGKLLTYDKIIFNELYNNADDANDWLELRNVSNVDIPLDKWKLTIQTGNGSVIIPFPEGTAIAAGEVLLITNRKMGPAEASILSIVVKSFALPQSDFALILRSPTAFGYLAGNYFQDASKRPKTAPEFILGNVYDRAQSTVSGYRSEAWAMSTHRNGMGSPGYHPSAVAGDLNNDGVVNILDLVLVASQFGTTGITAADLNGDNTVNIQDLVLVANALNAVAGAPPVKQPTAALVNSWLQLARQNTPAGPETSLSDALSYARGMQVLEQLLAALTPETTALLANYPNPFNPETWIPYQLAKPADVRISIYASDGSVVRTLALGHQVAGMYKTRTEAAYWDGTNALGETVASGLYFYTLTAGDFSATRRMLILK